MRELSHADLGHLPDLYVPYGFAFLLLGVVLLAAPRDRDLPDALADRTLLAAFGLIHGSLEIWTGWRLLHGIDGAWPTWLSGFGLLASYLPLLEIARRHLATRHPSLFVPWTLLLPLAAVVILARLSEQPAVGFIDASRVLVGLPGAVGTGLALLAGAPGGQRPLSSPVSRALRVAGLAFILYGLSAGLVSDHPSDAGWLWSSASFADLTGIPVQLLRTGFAAVLALSFVLVLNGTRREASERLGVALESARSAARTLEAQVLERTEALRESEQRLRQAQRVAETGSWHRDLRTGTLDLSEQTFLIFGQEPGPSSAARIRHYIHPEDVDAVEKTWSTALAGGSFDLEHRIIVAGQVKWVRQRARIEYDASGAAVSAIGTIQDITGRKEAESKILEGQLLTRALIDATPDWIFVKDHEYRFLLVNLAFAASHQLEPEDMVGRPDTDFSPRRPADGDAGLDHGGLHVDDDRALVGSVVHNPRDVAILGDGQQRIFDTLKLPLRDSRHRIYGVLAYARDVTARQLDAERLESTVKQLRDAEARQRDLAALARREQLRMSALLSAMSIGILFEDDRGHVEYVNPAFQKMWGIQADTQLVGRPTRSVLEYSSHRFARADHTSRHVLAIPDTHEVSERFELDLMDGRILTQISYPVDDAQGRTLGRLWIYEDITHERQTAQQLIYLAQRDALTGLYNRHRFQERLDDMVKIALRSGQRFALLYFDLDEFKQINDNFGHRAGDTVLVRAAGELSAMLRATELFARLGGDEFAILCSVTARDDVAALANRIVSAVAGIPFRFRGTNIRVTTSVGVAVFPDHGSTSDDLVVHADMAMYQAKSNGRNTWAMFDPSQGSEGSRNERTTWSRRIEKALADDGVVVHFQGIHHNADGTLAHLEALARMRDPQAPQRLIMPGQFIPFAERTGQVLDIDRRVLRIVVAQLAAKPDMPSVAVNVSGRSFDDPELPQFIRALLREHDVEPRRLLVELTETAAVSDLHDAQRFIEALKKLGCRVCLDDFGSGFSSFAYLKHVNADVLKIDSLFTHDLAGSHDNRVFLRAMVDVARGLRMATVAEGVESAEVLRMVRELGVDMAQGYYLDRPQEDHPGLAP